MTSASPRRLERLSEIWTQLEAAALRLGAIRIGASDLDDDHAATFADWLGARYHASMTYLERNLVKRRDPRQRFPWGRSVVVILVPYDSERPSRSPDSIASHIARYAQGDDYHDVVDAMLRELEAILATTDPHVRSWRHVDTGPFSDRSLAFQAGLGWIGKNAMLIDPELGSYLFIGTLVTSLENDMHAAEVADRCGECTRCIDACPTNAILPGRLVDSNRCISYLTIEHRGAIESDLADQLAGNVFGCDICQEACPWNEHAPPPHPTFRTRDTYRVRPVTDLLRLTRAEFSSFLRGSAVKRAKRAGLVRNAILAGGQLSENDVAVLSRDDEPGIRSAIERRRP